MNYRWLVILACVLVTACSSSTDPKKDAEPAKPADTKPADTKPADTEPADTDSADTDSAETKPAEKADSTNPAAELAAEFLTARNEFMAKIRTAPQADRAELMKSNPTVMFVEKFRTLAAENSDSEIEATALSWLAANSSDADEKASALENLLENYLDSPVMKDVAGAIVGGKPSKSAENNLRRLLENSPHRDVRGAATHHLVSYFDRYGSLADRIDELAENPSAVNFFGEEGIEYLRNLKVDSEEVEKLYESIVKDYSDVVLEQFGRKTNIGEAAKNALYELRNLSLGCVAPDIEGSDLDGKDFALSDYRGKVVMLDFWGDW